MTKLLDDGGPAFPVLIAVLLSLTACQRVDASEPKSRKFDVTDVLPIVTDPETGCQYIGYSSHGLSPRLDRNGKPICGGVK